VVTAIATIFEGVEENPAMSLVSLPKLKETIDEISAQRNLPKYAVENALREALLKGYERFRRTHRATDSVNFEEGYFDNFDIELDIEYEDEQGFRVLASKTIAEEVENPDHQIALAEVLEVAPEAQVGDVVVLDVTPEQKDFGRMAAIQTKQVLAQKLRDQQRKLIQEEFQDLEGTVLTAKVQRFERQSVIMTVSSGTGQPEVEAELLKRDQLPNDNYRPNSQFRAVLKKVSEGSHRGPQLLVSRADAALVVELFSNEVPEIEDEIVRIVAVAREANPPSRSVGPRTKIAVDTAERDVDPVGACIGARGSRIQAVVSELRGEKIDVIRYSLDPATYIANALSPARVDEVRLMNPEDRQAHVLVPEDQLSLAIGKEGQNVRLAAKLTGWKIDIKDTAKYDYAEEDRKLAEQLAARQAEEAAREAAAAARREEEEARQAAKAARLAAIAAAAEEEDAREAAEAAALAAANGQPEAELTEDSDATTTEESPAATMEEGSEESSAEATATSTEDETSESTASAEDELTAEVAQEEE
jgi:N utilization substance protein A